MFPPMLNSASSFVTRRPTSLFMIVQEGAHGQQMRCSQTDILNREPLRKLGAAVGARYIFQPRFEVKIPGKCLTGTFRK